MNSTRIASERLQDLSAGEMAAVEGGAATVLVEVVEAIIGGLTDFAGALAAAVKVGYMLRQMK